YIYLLIGGIAGAALLLLTLGLFLLRRNRIKRDDESYKGSSILVYPSHQGCATPQFLTKEIHFSLPPMRSTSLGDLNENDQDSDVDIDTDSLLPATSSHNQRSNSFSCYGLGVIEPSLYRSTLDLDEIQWPEGHIGRIWFSLRYEPSTEKLLVSLLKAKNLPSRTVGTVNSCDPLVRLHLMPDERRYLQSRPKKKTCNPYFDETLVFQ
ncbi:PREDICTED: synaptotagmin-15-like, partial [Nicrophorus vespilloides]|uniref:Synaptotagmin-15-like n=1 Tax=Nicrophorus vespilloides TaxID=110193 RepID=A0ABM1MSY4_NICVS